MDPICQSSLPNLPWVAPHRGRLPGTGPLDFADWLVVDDAFDGQMALRDRLLVERRGDVFLALDGSEAACRAALDLITAHLGPRYVRNGNTIRRPDGVEVPLHDEPSLVTAARLVQEDLCILQPDGQGQHRLTAAVLCFPASWTLAEKIGRPLDVIHAPVESYTPDITRRVQRLFDALHPDRPLWRQNALLYADPGLYQPRPEQAPRPEPEVPRYVRSERQCLIKLPDTDAVLFSIHTYVVPIGAISIEDRAHLDKLEAVG